MVVFILALQAYWALAESTADNAVLLFCCIAMGAIV